MKKKLYRTVIEIEVLSEEPIQDDMTLDDIEYECNEGGYSGVHNYKLKNSPVEGMQAVELVIKQGSSLDFFSMDEEGNDLDDCEYLCVNCGIVDHETKYCDERDADFCEDCF